jgi:serine/threonine protein kinase
MQRPAFSVGLYRSTSSEPIGRGSFAYVYRGAHSVTGQPCAIKEIDVARLKHTNAKLMEHVESEISEHRKKKKKKKKKTVSAEELSTRNGLTSIFATQA